MVCGDCKKEVGTETIPTWAKSVAEAPDKKVCVGCLRLIIRDALVDHGVHNDIVKLLEVTDAK